MIGNRWHLAFFGLAVVISVLSLPVAGQTSGHKASRQAPSKKTAAQPAPSDEVRYSTTLLHNADITIRRLNIPQGDEAGIPESVHDYLIISIGSNSIAARGSGSSFDLALRPGDMQVLQGGWKHALVNTGQAEAELFMIEPAHNIDPKSAICGLGKKSCTEHDFGETAAGTFNQNLQFETDTTKLYRLSVDGGVVTHLHADGLKHLIVALTPFQGHIGKESFTLPAGGMRWVPNGFEELGNDGKDEVRLLVLDIK